MSNKSKEQARKIRHLRIRKTISGTAEKPRINIFKSNKNFYAQIIDDKVGKTIVSSSTIQLKINGCNIENAKKVALDLATKAKTQNIKTVVFDRSGYIYHGKIKEFADILREQGLDF